MLTFDCASRAGSAIPRAGSSAIWMLLALPLLVLPGVTGARAPAQVRAAQLIPVETFVLSNGLRVVLNVDRSDPVVAVALVAHVGSAREQLGRTGFAHLFEHLFFLNSENLGPGGLDRLSARIGGDGASGYTNFDQTVYLQTAPRDALEKMIWAEADKLGWFINTVTPAVVAKEIQVVRNEIRQSVDNVPYGQTEGILLGALFPSGHPYSWKTLGTPADLKSVTVDDVRQFYRKWYSPNNATLIVSGDFDPAQTRTWVEKYFGEIPRGPAIDGPGSRPIGMSATKRLYHVDALANLAQLTVAWPTPPKYSRDAFALSVLVALLTDAPDGAVYRSVVEEAKLSDNVRTWDWGSQLATLTGFEVRAFDGVPLDKVYAAIQRGLLDFERNGATVAQLDRVKAAYEKALYRAIESVRGKAQLISDFETLLRRPDFTDELLANVRRVDASDVLRVYRTYLKDKAHVELSVVPRLSPELARTGSERAIIVEEPSLGETEAPVDQAQEPSPTVRTASTFDRTIEPPAGPAPIVEPPAVWTASLPHGLPLSGIEDRELPVVQIEISIAGGQVADDPRKPGTAFFTAEMIRRGTRTKTRAQIETALKQLGAEFDVRVGEERTVISVSTLARNFRATVLLLEDTVLHPRFDPAELALAKASAKAELEALAGDPAYLAATAARRILYGPGSNLARDVRGDPGSIAAIVPEDLRRHHAIGWSSNAARIRVVGAVSPKEAERAFTRLARVWPRAELPLPASPTPESIARTNVYFLDVPGAKQSQLLFVAPGPRRAAPDFFVAQASNYILGGGGFASRLTQELRERKGYTYSIRSGFAGKGVSGVFSVTSPVRTNVTLEAAALSRDIIRDFGKSFTAADLELTKTALTKARARQFESLSAKMKLLADLGDYGLPLDLVSRENAQLSSLTIDQVRATATRYFDTDRMNIIIVGDAVSQAGRLAALGYGEPIMLGRGQ